MGHLYHGYVSHNQRVYTLGMNDIYPKWLKHINGYHIEAQINYERE